MKTVTEEEMRHAMDSMEEGRRLRALEAIFEKGGINSELYDFDLPTRLFCLLKTWVCLKLKKTGGDYTDSGKFCILSYDERGCMGYSTWDAVWVSPRVFADWNVCISSDGT